MIENVIDTFWKMASPLSPLSPSSQNARTLKPAAPAGISPSKNLEYHHESSTSETYTTFKTQKISFQDEGGEKDPLSLEAKPEPFSSPFIKDAAALEKAETPGPSKKPLNFKIATDDNVGNYDFTEPRNVEVVEGFEDSPTRMVIAPVQDAIEQPTMEDSIIHHAIDSLDEGMSTIYHNVGEDNTETSLNVDAGDLSTFSAVPNTDMTLFANLRRGSPTKFTHNGEQWSPSKQLFTIETPPTYKHRSRSPQKRNMSSDDEECGDTPRAAYEDDHTDLLNFTGQSFAFPPPTPGTATAARMARRSPSGRGAFPVKPSSPTKSQAALERERATGGGVNDRRAPTSSPSKRASFFHTATPVSQRTNLLDLDLDPIPTPRSIPTITPRELESLRSSLTSEISSLSATLSGKEAEVSALKRAVTDAEARVGKAMEERREETLRREGLEAEKEDLQKRASEMERLLREVRQEVLVLGREGEKAREKQEQAERKGEEMRSKVEELEAQLEAAKRCHSSANGSGSKEAENVPATPRSHDVDAAVKEATERVARELHGLYKGKHETKVAALKKSYEARWEKRVRELEGLLKNAQEELVTLKTEKEQTMSGVVPSNLLKLGNPEEEEKLRKEVEECEAKGKVLQAKIEGLERELEAVKSDADKVRGDLESERVEKGELVSAVDVWLKLQDEAASAVNGISGVGGGDGGEDIGNASIISLQDGIDHLRSSISRATVGMGGARHQSHLPPARGSGIRTPGEMRTGRAPVGMRGAMRAGRSRSNSRTRIGNPPGGGAVRSGLMEGIARMGGGGGRGGAPAARA